MVDIQAGSLLPRQSIRGDGSTLLKGTPLHHDNRVIVCLYTYNCSYLFHNKIQAIRREK
jgi:hypothetical protein